MEQTREYKHLGNPPGKESGGGYASNWGFSDNVQRPTILDPYSTQARKVIRNLQGKEWQTKNPEHRHLVLIKLLLPYWVTHVTNRGNKVTGLPTRLHADES